MSGGSEETGALGVEIGEGCFRVLQFEISLRWEEDEDDERCGDRIRNGGSLQFASLWFLFYFYF